MSDNNNINSNSAQSQAVLLENEKQLINKALHLCRLLDLDVLKYVEGVKREVSVKEILSKCKLSKTASSSSLNRLSNSEETPRLPIPLLTRTNGIGPNGCAMYELNKQVQATDIEAVIQFRKTWSTDNSPNEGKNKISRNSPEKQNTNQNDRGRNQSQNTLLSTASLRTGEQGKKEPQVLQSDSEVKNVEAKDISNVINLFHEIVEQKLEQKDAQIAELEQKLSASKPANSKDLNSQLVEALNQIARR